jgi:hypothetical protein
MDAPSGNRLTGTTSDNHQPWLWFSHFFFLFCVASAGGLRFWIKQKYYGMSDVVSLVAHVRYLDMDLYRGETHTHLLMLLWLALLYFLLDHSAVRIDQWSGEIRSTDWSGS